MSEMAWVLMDSLAVAIFVGMAIILVSRAVTVIRERGEEHPLLYRWMDDRTGVLYETRFVDIPARGDAFFCPDNDQWMIILDVDDETGYLDVKRSGLDGQTTTDILEGEPWPRI